VEIRQGAVEAIVREQAHDVKEIKQLVSPSSLESEPVRSRCQDKGQ
jgi:hypothetical protein